MIAQQGRKLRQRRRRDAQHTGEGQHHRENVRAEEVALVHVRQEEGDTHREEERRRVHRPDAKPIPTQKAEQQHRQHERHRARDAEVRRVRRRGSLPENGVDGRGVVVEAVADAPGLGGVESEGFGKGLAQQHRRQHQQHIEQRHQREVPELIIAPEPQNRHDRQQEHRLELEAEGEREAEYRQDGPVGEGKPQPQQREGDIDAVALAPERAVEYHRRQIQHREKAGEQQPALLPDERDKLHRRKGQQHVEEDAQELDEKEIPDREIGEQAEKIQIGDIVVSQRVGEGAEAEVIAVEGDPLAEKILVIQRLIGQTVRAQQERPRRQRDGEPERGI